MRKVILDIPSWSKRMIFKVSLTPSIVALYLTPSAVYIQAKYKSRHSAALAAAKIVGYTLCQRGLKASRSRNRSCLNIEYYYCYMKVSDAARPLLSGSYLPSAERKSGASQKTLSQNLKFPESCTPYPPSGVLVGLPLMQS